jgi:alpha-mannosidase
VAADPLADELMEAVQARLTEWSALEIEDRRPLQLQAAPVGGEPIGYDAALGLPFRDFSVGEQWGAAWDTWWFRLGGEIPPAWAGRPVVVRLVIGDGATGFAGEGMLWRDGRPVTGVAPRHSEYVWTDAAAAGERVTLLLEAAANPVAMGAVVPDGVQSGPLLYTVSVAELAVVRDDVRALTRDLRLLRDLARLQPERDDVRDALRAAVGAAPAEAAQAMQSVLGKPAAAGAHRVIAVGNAHIDTAWLWPFRETRRKTARTLATAFAWMARYPDYHFALSQPQQVAWLQESYPDLFARLREQVAAGQVQPVGAMWVEPDCNVPSGESLVRQLVEGKRYWQQQLGVDVQECWLPDAFGYTASLPQLLRLAGVRWFVSQKLSWNDTNRFAHHTFWWQGIDGSRVLAHFPPGDTYSGVLNVGEILTAQRNETSAGTAKQSLFLYGLGDGGGGPTQGMLERARRLASVEGLPRVEQGTARAFLEAAERDAADAPVWGQELYFEKHRGTYTTHARVKRGNRQLEQALLAAERWCLAASRAGGPAYPADDLRALWRSLLLHQFHDVLPGTSIAWVYRDTFADYERIRAETDRLTDAAQQHLAAAADGETIAFNAAPFPRREVVEGRWVDVPPNGYASVADDARPPGDVAPVTVDDRLLDNGLLRVRLDEAGHLVSVLHRATGREALAGPANVLQLLDDRPAQWDAWDIDAWTMDTAEPVDAVESMEVVEATPLRAAIRVVRRFGASCVEQTISVSAGSPRVDLHTRVDWHEEHRLLKVAYPVDVHSRSARCEMQFGYVERPTHRDTSYDAARFEVCAHRWIDLSEDGFGVALLNDGRYGHDVRGNVIRMSLLRAPLWPDPAADRGVSEVRHALLPHAGDLRPVVAQAYALNAPIVLRPAGGDRAVRVGLVEIDEPGIVVEAVKRADESDGVVVRVYESLGGRRRGALRTVWPVSEVTEVDLLERPIGEAIPVTGDRVDVELRPFEIRTLLLT